MSTVAGVRIRSKWGSFLIGIIAVIMILGLSLVLAAFNVSIPFFGLIIALIVWLTCVWRKGDTLYYVVGLILGIILLAIAAVILGLALLGFLFSVGLT